jgi:hypothetical protein
MKMTRLTRATVLATAMSALLVSCGGGGEDINVFKSPLNGGIWHGTDSISGQNVYGIVAEGGDFRFIRADMVQYAGSATFDTRGVAASFEGFAPLGFTFPDGSVHGTGSASGVLQAQKSMDLALTFVTDASSAPENGLLNLSYDKLYERTSSVFTIAGNFGTGGQTQLTITTSGIVSGQAANGCVANGTVTTDDPQHNVYKMTLTYANCTGGSASLNGVALTGSVTLDNSRSPERLFGGVSAGTTSAVISLDRV